MPCLAWGEKLQETSGSVMFVLGILIALLTIASYTDFRTQTIDNSLTYSGILAGIALRTMFEGWTGLEDAVQGFFLCGGIMLVCFVVFGLGGGDVKLLAMMGTFLGWHRGFEALLWTFVIGGALGAMVLVWQFGFFRILRHTIWQLVLSIRARGWVPLTAEERKPLQQTLFLAPAALAATVIVTWSEWSPGSPTLPVGS
ncbi:MAG: prepilin peptidase [Planctomycetaceae bacterium]|nr:prepilin peptidase [Planctomycetaceae bacterium]